MPTLYEQQDSYFAQAMLEVAINNQTVKNILSRISEQLRIEVLQEIIFLEQECLTPAINSLAAQHASGDMYIGALLPEYSKEFLNDTVEGRSMLLDALDQCLKNAATITTTHDFLALMKAIDGMAYLYDFLQIQKNSRSHAKLKDYIAPTPAELAIRRQRPEQLLAVTYGIGTEKRDLSATAKIPLAAYSGKARFFIVPTEHRTKIWFEKLADQCSLNKPSLPLIAGLSNAAAQNFMMAYGLNLFFGDEQFFDLNKAQVFANCIMAYLVYCGHHSCIEVMEVWNRALDYLVIEHPEQMDVGPTYVESDSLIPYFKAEDAVEKKLPYVKIGLYSSFLNQGYRNVVMQRMDVLLSEAPDLSFHKATSTAFLKR